MLWLHNSEDVCHILIWTSRNKYVESVRNSSAESISHTLKRSPSFKGNSNEPVNPSIWYQNVQFFKFWESARTEHESRWEQSSQEQHYFNLRRPSVENVKGFLLLDILEMCLVTDDWKHFCISSFYTRAKRLGICFVSCCSAFAFLLTVQSENNKQLVLTEIWFFSDHWIQDFLLSQQIGDIIPLITWLQQWATGRTETQNRQPEV